MNLEIFLDPRRRNEGKMVGMVDAHLLFVVVSGELMFVNIAWSETGRVIAKTEVI